MGCSLTIFSAQRNLAPLREVFVSVQGLCSHSFNCTQFVPKKPFEQAQL